MRWRLLIFRARRSIHVLVRLAAILVVGTVVLVTVRYAMQQRRYLLTVNIAPPFVGEGVEVYTGCCHIVDQLAGDRRAFLFVLPPGDYAVGGDLAQNGEFRPLPAQLVFVHLDHDQTITLAGG